MIRKDGTKMPVEMVLRYLEYHNNEFVCCFCRDISERTRMERTLHLANKKLNVLTSLTRHDIQNKVTVLLGTGKGAEKGEDPVVLEYLERQEHAANAIRDEITITRDFKDLGADPPEWLNIRNVVAAAVTRYSDTPEGFLSICRILRVRGSPDGTRVFPVVRKCCQCQTPSPGHPCIFTGRKGTEGGRRGI